MANKVTLSIEEYEAIKQHNDLLANGSRKLLAALRWRPRKERTSYENGMVDYHHNVIQCLKWSTDIAAQRAGVVQDGGRDTIAGIADGIGQGSGDRPS